jgi:PAS domain S-box-containing protein
MDPITTPNPPSVLSELLSLARSLCGSAPEESLLYARRAIESAVQHDDTLSEAEANVCAATALIALNRKEEGVAGLTRAVDLFQHLGDDIRTLDVQSQLVETSIAREDYSLAKSVSLRGLLLSERLGRSSDIMYFQSNIGSACFYLSEYKPALDAYRAALRIAGELGDDKGSARMFNNIGNVYWAMGFAESALESYAKSLEIKERLGNREDIGRALIGLGNISFKAGAHETALSYYERARGIFEIAGDQVTTAKCLTNIGLVLRHQGKPDQALLYYLQALEASEIISRDSLAGLYNNLGVVHRDLGDLRQALEDYTQSIEIKRVLNDRAGICASLLNISEVYLRLDNPEPARKPLDEAMRLALDIGSRDLLKDAYQHQADFSEQIGDFETAHRAFRRFFEIHEAISHDLHEQQISELRFAHEYRNTAGNTETTLEPCETSATTPLPRDIEEMIGQFHLLERIIDNIPTAISYKDEKGRFLGCNRYYERILGRPRREIIGRTVFELFPHDVAQRLEDEDKDILDRPRVLSYERTFLIRGIERRSLIHKAPIRREDGSVAGVIGTIIDVHEMRQTEEELRAALDKLRMAQDALLSLERKNSALAVAVTASHELNQPLMVLTGNLEMIEMQLPADVMSDRLKRNLEGVFKAVETIRSILERFRHADGLHFESYSGQTQMAVFDEPKLPE